MDTGLDDVLVELNMTTSTNSCLLYSMEYYSAVLGLWPQEELAELADGPTRRGELASGGCL